MTQGLFTCPECKGIGKIEYWTADAKGGGDEWKEPCEKCKGTGQVPGQRKEDTDSFNDT